MTTLAAVADDILARAEGWRDALAQVRPLGEVSWEPLPRLDGMTLTFEDTFQAIRSRIAPGDSLAEKTWYAGAQGGPYGLANVGEAVRNDVYVQSPSGLIIRAHKTPGGNPAVKGGWYSGHLQTVNRAGQGFAQRLGYFEARMRFPLSYMAWPSFWLKPRDKWTDKTAVNVEIDVIEWYGMNDQQRHHHTVHIGQGASRVYRSHTTTIPVDFSDWHTYGVLLDERWVTIDMDRTPIARFPMRDEWRDREWYPQLTLSINGHGNELPHAHEAHSPMDLEISAVRVWASQD